MAFLLFLALPLIIAAILSAVLSWDAASMAARVFHWIGVVVAVLVMVLGAGAGVLVAGLTSMGGNALQGLLTAALFLVPAGIAFGSFKLGSKILEAKADSVPGFDR